MHRRKKYTAFLVSHTHWDRAWYLTFQTFRIKLVQLINNLLSILKRDARFKSFTLDGQTIVLEDYLEIHPEKEEEFREFISSGRIFVGPWYVLPDEFLVSGEALVRNLLIGHQIASTLGRVMKVGYVPDPFGHISQLPQILQGFGIDNFIFTKGMVKKGNHFGTEFVWESPDAESSVLAIHQVEGHFNASLLGYPIIEGDISKYKFDMESALRQIKDSVEKLIPRTHSSYLLLGNGCDHVEPQPEVPDIIKYANERLKNIEIVHGSFLDYIQCVKREKLRLGRYRGELRSSWKWALLAGTISSRIYIKQANDAVERLLEKWVEPICVFAWVVGRRNYPGKLIRQAWKYVIQNHPHDDICGCSIDEVHRENMHLFGQARQIGEALLEGAIDGIIAEIDTTAEEGITPFVVFNPLAWQRNDLFEIELKLPVPTLETFSIQDSSGREIPYQIRRREKVSEWVRDKDKFIDFERISLALSDKTPSFGYKTYFLGKGTPFPLSSCLRTLDREVENSFFKLTINADGTLKILEKNTGSLYKNCLVFEDTEDGGDEYNFSPIKNTETYTTRGGKAKITLVEKGPILATYSIKLDWNLPASLSPDRRRRSTQKATCPLVSFVTCYEGSPRIDIRTEFENKVLDHRLRVLFQTDIETNFSFADSAFTVEKRPIDPPSGKELLERITTHPQRSFVLLNNGKRGLAVVSRGLPEFEIVRRREGNTIAITLLRGVGWLSRDDLLTRKGNAGPSLTTPQAQCLGKHTFHYSIIPHSGRWEKPCIQRLSSEYNVPLKGRVIVKKKGILPPEMRLLSVEPANLVVTCIKKAEETDAVILRFFNTTTRNVKGKIKCSKTIKKAILTDLKEEPISGFLKTNLNEINLKVKRNKIVTIKLFLSR